MILTSTKPLSNGQHKIVTDSPWKIAHREGLYMTSYGRLWFVYESEAEYQASLD